jgi:hypothetical protein
LGSNVGTLLLAQAKPGVFPEATMPCPILRRNLPMAIAPIGPLSAGSQFLSGLKVMRWKRVHAPIPLLAPSSSGDLKRAISSCRKTATLRPLPLRDCRRA